MCESPRVCSSQTAWLDASRNQVHQFGHMRCIPMPPPTHHSSAPLYVHHLQQSPLPHFALLLVSYSALNYYHPMPLPTHHFLMQRYAHCLLKLQLRHFALLLVSYSGPIHYRPMRLLSHHSSVRPYDQHTQQLPLHRSGLLPVSCQHLHPTSQLIHRF